MQDFIGNELNPGDFVVYAFASGRSSASMRFAKVLGYKDATHSVYDYKINAYIQQPFQKLSIVGCDWYTDYIHPTDPKLSVPAHATLMRKSLVERGDCFFQIERSQIPVEAQKLMDGIR